ncbi:MAG: hypothetical protein HC897_05715 [Thermoanaerobaculia bacterium]|nr:hypothetical protein [Thermoanaerobaculia bacterium]
MQAGIDFSHECLAIYPELTNHARLLTIDQHPPMNEIAFSGWRQLQLAQSLFGFPWIPACLGFTEPPRPNAVFYEVWV